MAQYRLSVRIISRSQRKGGRSVVAAAAYRACRNLKDTKYGLTHYYARKQGNVSHTMFGVADGPQWAKDAQGFWNAVEKAEDGHNRSASAQLARELQLNIPVELDGLRGRTLFTKWIREVLEPLGMSGQGDLHEDEEGRNPHGHILIAFRELRVPTRLV